MVQTFFAAIKNHFNNSMFMSFPSKLYKPVTGLKSVCLVPAALGLPASPELLKALHELTNVEP